eukprot:TRINITY_DN14252_c0_g2_i3.p1 TRINITY_DN14252_c0_g2~~TRINITY_DN14252_c0_g2_i3.p1  ORF type:complete len:210 (-),score=-0.53 TRINITY_DN14252_c0_g2_i3:236-865(-)
MKSQKQQKKKQYKTIVQICYETIFFVVIQPNQPIQHLKQNIKQLDNYYIKYIIISTHIQIQLNIAYQPFLTAQNIPTKPSTKEAFKADKRKFCKQKKLTEYTNKNLTRRKIIFKKQLNIIKSFKSQTTQYQCFKSSLPVEETIQVKSQNGKLIDPLVSKFSTQKFKFQMKNRKYTGATTQILPKIILFQQSFFANLKLFQYIYYFQVFQ